MAQENTVVQLINVKHQKINFINKKQKYLTVTGKIKCFSFVFEVQNFDTTELIKRGKGFWTKSKDNVKIHQKNMLNCINNLSPRDFSLSPSCFISELKKYSDKK